MTHPYREPETREEQAVEETPEAVLFDTLKRLNNLDEDDAQRVIRGLAAFMGFSVGASTVDGDEYEEDDDA